MTSEQAGANAPDSDVIAFDLTCVGCGYNLRTLSWSARCPECGIDVAASRLPAGTSFESWRQLRRLRWALVLLVAAGLVVTIAQIGIGWVFRWQYDAPRWWLMQNVYLWSSSLSAAHTMQIIVVLAATYPCWMPRRPGRSRLGLAACFFGLASWGGHMVSSWGRFLIFAPLFSWCLFQPFRVDMIAVSRVASMVLFWAFLMSRLDRRRERLLWFSALIAALGSALPLLSEFSNVLAFSLFDRTNIWTNWFVKDLWNFTNWWQDLGNELAWLISVLAAWIWIRRLRRWMTPRAANKPADLDRINDGIMPAD